MPTNNNAANLRAWLRQCPTVERNRMFGADYLADNESYSLDVVPTALKYRENILGEMELRATQEQNFVFASRDPYGAEFQQNLDNLGVMQDVASWIMDQRQGFPRLGGRRGDGHPADADRLSHHHGQRLRALPDADQGHVQSLKE